MVMISLLPSRYISRSILSGDNFLLYIEEDPTGEPFIKSDTVSQLHDNNRTFVNAKIFKKNSTVAQKTNCFLIN